MENKDITRVFLKNGYMGAIGDIRAIDSEGTTYIIENALEFLQKAIDSKGYKEVFIRGTKIPRIKINE